MVMELLAFPLYFYISLKILCFFLIEYSRFLSLIVLLSEWGGAKTFHLVVVLLLEYGAGALEPTLSLMGLWAD